MFLESSLRRESVENRNAGFCEDVHLTGSHMACSSFMRPRDATINTRVRARSYIPTQGRFLQEDPAGYIDGPNRYQLESSQPIIGLDPTGLDHEIEINCSQDIWDFLNTWGGYSADTLNDIKFLFNTNSVSGKDADYDKITLISHGGPGYIGFGSNSGDPWLDIKPSTLGHKDSDADKLIAELAARLKPNGIIDFASCNSGKGNNGEELLKALQEAFKRHGRPDVTVILHKKYIHAHLFGPTEEDS